MFTASDFLPLHVLLAATCTTLAGWMRFIGGPNYYYTLGSSLLEGLSSSGLYVCLPSNITNHKGTPNRLQ